MPSYDYPSEPGWTGVDFDLEIYPAETISYYILAEFPGMPKSCYTDFDLHQVDPSNPSNSITTSKHVGGDIGDESTFSATLPDGVALDSIMDMAFTFDMADGSTFT